MVPLVLLPVLFAWFAALDHREADLLVDVVRHVAFVWVELGWVKLFDDLGLSLVARATLGNSLYWWIECFTVLHYLSYGAITDHTRMVQVLALLGLYHWTHMGVLGLVLFWKHTLSSWHAYLLVRVGHAGIKLLLLFVNLRKVSWPWSDYLLLGKVL